MQSRIEKTIVKPTQSEREAFMLQKFALSLKIKSKLLDEYTNKAVNIADTLIKARSGNFDNEFRQIYVLGKKSWGITCEIQENLFSFLGKDTEEFGSLTYGGEAFSLLKDFMSKMMGILSDFSLEAKEKRILYTGAKASFGVAVSKYPQLENIAWILTQDPMYKDYPISLENKKDGDFLSRIFALMLANHKTFKNITIEFKDSKGVDLEEIFIEMELMQ